MTPGLSVSVIVTTRNHASALRQTLETLGKVKIAKDCQAELIVVDNASTDDTAAILRTAKFANLKAKYLYEPTKGKSNALNTALGQAQGEYILFTDDDVLVSEDWVERMIQTFIEHQADAVVGKIVLAEDLARTWLSPLQKWWLAAPDDQLDENVELIGANMGFRRSVLKQVPRFDPELGPGKLGFGEETLFGKQLLEAGFKIKYAPKAMVIHRPDESRLRRRDWLNTARKKGHQEAYFLYHWEHDDIQAPRLKWLRYLLKLHLRRILQRPVPLDSEGVSAWEMNYVRYMETFRRFCRERRRPRNYARRGLNKRRAIV